VLNNREIRIRPLKHLFHLVLIFLKTHQIKERSRTTLMGLISDSSINLKFWHSLQIKVSVGGSSIITMMNCYCKIDAWFTQLVQLYLEELYSMCLSITICKWEKNWEDKKNCTDSWIKIMLSTFLKLLIWQGHSNNLIDWYM